MQNGLLVLSRRKGDAVQIGKEVCVTVEEIKGQRVRLSFSAPKDVPIWRSEIKERAA